MLRILLPLIPLLVWFGFSDPRETSSAHSGDIAPLLYLWTGMLIPVAIMALWARVMVRRVSTQYIFPSTRRFGLGMSAARVLMITWFGVCTYYLGYGDLILSFTAKWVPWKMRFPSLLLATLPVWIGWLGLWWASYPVERATREQNLLSDLDDGRMVIATPTLRESLIANFRSQVLFFLAPILAAVIIRDVASVLLQLAQIEMTGAWDAGIFAVSFLMVYILSPELLIRVLHAHSLPASPLRTRLEAMAARMNLRYRDIMIWHTHFGFGNAAVMGLVPRFRYILLTDLLLETLDDRQIEAVFAHEAGHVQHRHLLWYVVFSAIFMLSISALDSLHPERLAERIFQHVNLFLPIPSGLFIFILAGVIFLSLFGMLSRMFEKQADAYAARAMQMFIGTPAMEVNAELSREPLIERSPVSSDGAESFVSALCRVAELNHLPMHRPRKPLSLWAAGKGRLFQMAANFLHPSIPDRVDHLRDLASDPNRTNRFDRKVVTVMVLMLGVLACLATWEAVAYFKDSYPAF